MLTRYLKRLCQRVGAPGLMVVALGAILLPAPAQAMAVEPAAVKANYREILATLGEDGQRVLEEWTAAERSRK